MGIEEKLREILCESSCGLPNGCDEAEDCLYTSMPAILALFPKPKGISVGELRSILDETLATDFTVSVKGNKMTINADILEIANKLNAYFGAGEGK